MPRPRRAVRKDGKTHRPSERPPNVISGVKRLNAKSSDARKADKLNWRRYDLGNWYVVGIRGSNEYIVSTHPTDVDADRARQSYIIGKLEYDAFRVEYHGSRGLVSKS